MNIFKHTLNFTSILFRHYPLSALEAQSSEIIIIIFFRIDKKM